MIFFVALLCQLSSGRTQLPQTGGVCSNAKLCVPGSLGLFRLFVCRCYAWLFTSTTHLAVDGLCTYTLKAITPR
eukprot:m.52832 g.52832  ORF g.52832 m.52832 type:complete len:74 (-) comp11339_c0_seq1:278-499(-)